MNSYILVLRLSAVVLISALFLTACASKSPIPEPGTRVTTTSEIFKRAASDLERDCEARGGCTCFIDGIRSICSLAFACLDFGFCKVAPIDDIEVR